MNPSNEQRRLVDRIRRNRRRHDRVGADRVVGQRFQIVSLRQKATQGWLDDRFGGGKPRKGRSDAVMGLGGSAGMLEDQGLAEWNAAR